MTVDNDWLIWVLEKNDQAILVVLARLLGIRQKLQDFFSAGFLDLLVIGCHWIKCLLLAQEVALKKNELQN